MFLYYEHAPNERYTGVCYLCCSPELFNYEDLLDNDSHTNLEHAFSRAHEKLGIDRLLDPEGYCHIVFFFRILSHFYVGSMFLTRRLHLARSCASSPDNSLSHIMTSRRSFSPSFPRHLHHHHSLTCVHRLYSYQYIIIIIL